MTTFVDPRFEGIIRAYLDCLARGMCPDCVREGKGVVHVTIEQQGHAFVAQPCGHVLWRTWGHHRERPAPSPQRVPGRILRQLRHQQKLKKNRTP